MPKLLSSPVFIYVEEIQSKFHEQNEFKPDCLASKMKGTILK